jgi:hypothetical protein
VQGVSFRPITPAACVPEEDTTGTLIKHHPTCRPRVATALPTAALAGYLGAEQRRGDQQEPNAGPIDWCWLATPPAAGIGAPFTVGYWVQERTSPAHFRMSPSRQTRRHRAIS